MIEFRQSLKIPQDHILHLLVPNAPKGEEVEVIVRTKKTSTPNELKLSLIALAANDPLFLQDIEEIADDFYFSDSEHQ
jgi:hypothetical protein